MKLPIGVALATGIADHIAIMSGGFGARSRGGATFALRAGRSPGRQAARRSAVVISTQYRGGTRGIDMQFNCRNGTNHLTSVCDPPATSGRDQGVVTTNVAT